VIELKPKSAVVSFDGSVLCGTYSGDPDAHGVAWLELRDGPPCTPGKQDDEKADAAYADDSASRVLLGFKHTASVDALIGQLFGIRAALTAPGE